MAGTRLPGAVFSLSCFFLLLALTGRTQNDSGSESPLVISAIQITGNQQTREHIILRELTFKVGDTINPGSEAWALSLERSKQNLINSALFQTVDMGTTTTQANVEVSIKVSERWYTWPEFTLRNAEPNFNIWWENKDFNRLNYGVSVTRENFRGRLERLRLRFQWGFAREVRLNYTIPYINKRQRSGVGISARYRRNNEIPYRTEDHERLFLKASNGFVREDVIVGLNYRQRLKLNTRQEIWAHFYYAGIPDTLNNLASDYLKSERTVTRFFSLSYHLRHDTRDRTAYPLTGFLLQGGISKDGLGILDNSNLNLLTAIVDYRHHFQLAERWFFATGARAKVSILDDPPYYLQQGLGFSSFVRGYEYYVLDGQHYGLLRTNFRFQLISPRQKYLNFIPLKKFRTFQYSIYLGFHNDAGWVADRLYDQENPLSNSILAGSGFGLDLLTFYDLVLRAEYSFNLEREGGFFLHFTKSI